MSDITFTGPDGFRTSVNSIRLYSDTTPMIKMPDFEDVVAKADTMILRPRGLQSFVEAMFLEDAIWEQGGNVRNLILPYVPGARQDRVNVTGDVLFTAKSVADMINQHAFDQVLIVDPHSPVIVELLDPVSVYPLERVAAKVWQGYTGIIAADKGGRERAEAFADAMGKPIFYGHKKRDVATGKLTGFGVSDLPKGGHFLVVDDICDGGGTFVGLGEKIKEQGCHADLFVTHGIFSQGSSKLREIYKNIYTTDTRFVHDHHVYVIDILKDMENYL